jgi:hypothetical protein
MHENKEFASTRAHSRLKHPMHSTEELDAHRQSGDESARGKIVSPAWSKINQQPGASE